MILNTQIFRATVEAAKAKVANQPAWLRAIDRAVVEIEKAKYWSFADGVLTIISTTSGKRYVIGDGHTCEAVGGICKHIAARRLMVRYFERLAAAEVPAVAEADEHAQLCEQIEAAWKAEKYTGLAVAAGLVRRFGVNHLSLVHLPYLRKLRAAQVRRMSA